MKKQMVNTVALILLVGFLLLSMMTTATYSKMREEKKLDFLQKKLNFDEDSQPVSETVLVYPSYNVPYVQSVLPGPLVPPPDTSRTR